MERSGSSSSGDGPTVPESGDGGIQFSRAATIGANYNPAQQQAAERAFGSMATQTLAERAKGLRANLGTKLRQGLVDQFAPIKEISPTAYILARLSKGSDGAVEAAMLYGKPFLRDGVADVDIKDGGFAKVLASLKGEHDRFFQWVAAQRAERLKAEGKENLLTDQDITALKSLNAGQFADGTPRMPAYAAALRELNAFNEASLKVAMESGLIDQAAYDLMKDQPYVPFYRLMEEDGGMRGPRFSSGLVNQQAWKKLKGGTQQLNADLLQNTLLNWSHLYAAAARNRASLETMKAAESMGVAYKVPADTKGAVKVMRDGMAEHWAAEDPYLLDAISAMSYAPGGLVKAMAPFKRLLTFGVTVNPTFKIRNLIRDSLSAMAQSDLSYNPLANVVNGWKATDKDSQTYASMLASGGIIKFGTQENSDRVRAQIERLGGEMLDKTGFDKLKGQMKSLWETYEALGDRTENVNRAALYERLIAKGHSHAEASFMARDLMDFSMSGKWEVVRFLTQTVPFLNARLQGLYKLGRAAKEDPKRFAAMAGAVSMASLALMAAYDDDEDWKKREDWDRDTYWWFKIGDKAFRIPKPFEVGAIGTLAERTAELMFSKEMTGKRFVQRISDMVFNTFAMDPTPQFIKPFIDVYANKDSFSGRPIEGMADERLRPQDRYNERTSEVARLLGSWGLPDPVRLAKGEYSGLSPKQVDFLLRGYFGWLATVSTTASDAMLRPALGRGERPEMRLRDAFLAGNFVETLPTGSSRYVTTMYEQAREVEQAWASYQAALKSGDLEKAQAIQQEEAPKLRNRLAVANAKRQISELGQQAKRIESSKLLSSEEKRVRLDAIEQRKHEAARRVAVTN
ncbi:LPD38 domain-containing protein [Ottowia sp. VDI28]|uniref:LPD38 domain-containing protein n=1 Tax=Ottowia sp. VDI28 TaxID=3133968 RepID=UPI003C2ED40A